MKAMKKSILLLAVFSIAAGVAVSRHGQRRAEVAHASNAARLRSVADQLADLAAQNRELAREWASTKSNKITAGEPIDELARLQAQAALLQTQKKRREEELARDHRATGSKLYSKGDFDLTTHNEEIGISFGGGPRAAGKLNDARVLTAALRQFAQDHGGVFPPSLDQAASYFAPPLEADSPGWQNAPLSGTNRFEIIYQGSQTDLTNIPPRRVALIREQPPWLAPDGKWARTYGYADGAASIVESDDNFQSWDAQHLIPPPASGP